MFNTTASFWFAVIGAIFLKILTTESFTLMGIIIKVVSGLYMAWTFSDATIAYLEIDRDMFLAPVGGILALSGEIIARAVLSIATLDDLISLYKRIKDKH